MKYSQTNQNHKQHEIINFTEYVHHSRKAKERKSRANEGEWKETSFFFMHMQHLLIFLDKVEIHVDGNQGIAWLRASCEHQERKRWTIKGAADLTGNHC